MIGTRSKAAKFQRKLEGELASGNYENLHRMTWADFRKKYEVDRLARLRVRTRRETSNALDHFERICKPKIVSAIRAIDIDKYATTRKGERGQKQHSFVSVATINKELRHIRAVFNVARKWEVHSKVPEIDMLKEPTRIPRFVPDEEFSELIDGCKVATYPKGLSYPICDWWRALLVFARMTGWRKSELLSLRRDDVDLNEGYTITRAEDNKGGRDERIPLHPLVIDYL